MLFTLFGFSAAFDTDGRKSKEIARRNYLVARRTVVVVAAAAAAPVVFVAAAATVETFVPLLCCCPAHIFTRLLSFMKTLLAKLLPFLCICCSELLMQY